MLLRICLLMSLVAGCDKRAGLLWAHDAIRCTLYSNTRGAPGSLGDSGERSLTLTPGEHGAVQLGPVKMSAVFDSEGFGVFVMEGSHLLHRGLYQFGVPLPENQFFGDHGFTGLIYMQPADERTNYQLICKSVSSSPDADRGNRYADERERKTAERIAKLNQTLNDVNGSLPGRADAIKELHKLRQRSFPHLQLARVNLDGADLRESHMPDSKFADASLRGASLYFNHLERADLRRANLEKANLYGVTLDGAHLDGANLRGVTLEHAKLVQTSLVGADLRGTFFWYANLTRANLQDANLEGANLEGADLRDANLHGANLKGAWLKAAKLQGAKLEGALNLTKEQLARAAE